MKVKCHYCSKEYDVRPYLLPTTKYCSRKCLALDHRVQTTSTCEICGTEFTHTASRANKAKYCSRTCYYKSMHRKGTIEHSCLHCGKIFYDSPSVKRKYCSISCVNKPKKEKWSPKFQSVRKNMMTRDMIKKCEKCGFDSVPQIL